MTKKNIIIAGYPKSGTTWLSRLVAELVSCPLQGDWGFEELDSPNKEGLDRKSEYQVYKSHHTFQEIENTSKLEIYKIIYIVRDPRDVVISGVHYFSFLPKLLAESKKKLTINRILRKTYNRLVSNKEKKRQMILAVLNGNKKLNPWLAYSWKDHYNSFSNKNILCIKYEDLIDSPTTECAKILNYLEISLNDENIIKSVEKQSFLQRKLKIKNGDEKQLKKLLRKGTYGNWKKELTKKEKDLFKNKIKAIDNLYDF